MEHTPPAQAAGRPGTGLLSRTFRNGALTLAAASLVGLAACADDLTRAGDVTELAAPVGPLFSGGGVTPENQPFVEGQIIVRFKPGANRAQIAASKGANIERELLDDRIVIMRVSAGREKNLAKQLARHPHVEYAEPDYLLSNIPCATGTCLPVNDIFFGRKWDLHNSGTIADAIFGFQGNTGRAGADIKWLETYTELQNTGGVSGTAVIGIIDSGVNNNHVDLAGKVIANRNFYAIFGTPNASSWQDTDGHGTHVAGIAAARLNNPNGGVPGVAYHDNIKVINARVCGLLGCPTSAVANAIRWATDQGAHVLNLSLGGAAPQTAMQDALRYANSRNVLAFCATGNDGHNRVSWPAAFPECVAVGSTNWSDERASYSNFGPETEISAPGGDSNPNNTAISLILSAAHNNNTGYVYMAGTSMATPQVAGLAALVRATTGITDREALRARLQSTTDDLGPAGWDPMFGHGRINVYRAVTGNNPVLPNRPPVANAGGPYSGVEGSPISFNGSGSSDADGDPLTFLWSFGDGTASTQMNPSHSYADDGSYTVRLTVSDGKLEHYAEIEVVVANVAPTASFNAPSQVGQGSNWTISLTNPFDPSSADLAAGFEYRFDCGSGYGAWGAASSANCSTTERGARSVRGEIRDKDGGVTEYTAGVTVAPVGPTVNAGENATILLGGTFWLNAGFTPVSSNDGPWSYSINWGDGTTTTGTTSNVSAIQAGREYTSVGARTVTVRVTDGGGSTGESTITVQVNYVFAGFFNPVQNGGVLNRARAGSAIPVKFSLNGNQGMNIFQSGSPNSTIMPCDATAGTNPVETITAGSSSLNYDASTGQYTYVWKTESSWRNSCRQLVVRFSDGTEQRANFQFTN